MELGDSTLQKEVAVADSKESTVTAAFLQLEGGDSDGKVWYPAME